MSIQKPRSARRPVCVRLLVPPIGMILSGLAAWCLVAGPIAVAAHASPIICLPLQDAAEGNTVTLHMEMPLAMALNTFARASGITFRLDPVLTQEAQGDRLSTKIAFDADGVPVETALRNLLNMATPPLTFRLEQGIYVIMPGKSASATKGSPAPAVHKLRFTFKNTPLDQALNRLFSAAQVPYRLDPSVHARQTLITVSIAADTFQSALSTLLAARGAEPLLFCRKEGNVFLIGPRQAGEVRRPDLALLPAPVPTSGRYELTTPGDNNDRGSIRVEEVPLGEVLNITLWWSNTLGILPRDLSERITVTVKQATAAQALDKILAATPAGKQLAYHEEDGLLVLAPASAAERALQPSEADITVHWRNVNLAAGLKALFHTLQRQYRLDPRLHAASITVACASATLDEALMEIAAASPTPMTVKHKEGVYLFALK